MARRDQLLLLSKQELSDLRTAVDLAQDDLHVNRALRRLIGEQVRSGPGPLQRRLSRFVFRVQDLTEVPE